MGAPRIFGRSAVVSVLLLGGLGCVDRERPLPAPGPGNGSGPVSEVLTPGEGDTVHIGTSFALDVRTSDPDGVDSIWTTLIPNVNTLQRFSGDGVTQKTVGYSPFIPNNPSLIGDTLVVQVQGLDVLGDTGAVFTRHLLIQ